jgi:imidazole glycerol-phosphate synthase subunit HisF
MGLAIRVIPTVLSKHGHLVKGKAFASDRVVGNALQATRIYASRGVDEICFFDVTATPEGRGPDFNMIEQLTDNLFAPVTYGGGVRSVDDVRQVLQAGADKVATNMLAMSRPDVIEEIASVFGRQVLVVVLDITEGELASHCGKWRPAIGGPVAQAAKWVESLGAGEILLQSIDRDGTMQGYDLDLIRSVSDAVNIPVIASGGCGAPHHALEAIRAGASAVAIGAMFQFADETPKSVAMYLQKNGIEVRI